MTIRDACLDGKVHLTVRVELIYFLHLCPVCTYSLKLFIHDNCHDYPNKCFIGKSIKIYLSIKKVKAESCKRDRYGKKLKYPHYFVWINHLYTL